MWLHQEKMKLDKLVKKLIIAISFILVAWMVLTIMHAVSYSVLVADDFSHGLQIGVFNTSFINYFLVSLAYAKEMYLTWQGTYFSMFLQALLSPINNFGYIQLKIIMMLNILFLFSSLIFFIYSLFDTLTKKEYYIKSIIVLGIVFCFLGYYAYEENYFWFSGATSYTMPLSFLFVALALLIKNKNDNIKYEVISAICGMLAMGGSLTIVGVGCYVAVIICIKYYLYEKKIPKWLIIITSLWIICALVNTLAPGNYIRHEVIDDSGMHPLISIFYTLRVVLSRVKGILVRTNFIFIGIVFFVCGLSINSDGKKVDIKNIIIAGLALFTPFVAIFPATLGFSSKNIPYRCEFIADACIYISALYFSFICGREIAKVLVEKKIKKIKIVLLVLALFIIIFDRYKINDIKILQIHKELKDKTYENYYNECKDFLDGLSKYEKDVDIRIPKSEFPRNIDNIYNFYLLEDSEHWVNKSISEYYGLKSISIYEDAE